MGRISGAAGKPARVASRRSDTKAPGGGSRGTVRLQLHLSTETAQRLGVHCSMVFRDKSRVADEVLSAWLRRYGRGVESFGPVEANDRLDVEPGVNLDGP